MGEYAGEKRFLFFLLCGLCVGVGCLASSGSDFLFPSLGVMEELISTLAVKCLRNCSSFLMRCNLALLRSSVPGPAWCHGKHTRCHIRRPRFGSGLCPLLRQ